jgi:hypothetical protein
MAWMSAPAGRQCQGGEERERESEDEYPAHRAATDSHRGAGMAGTARRSADSYASREQRPVSLHLEDPLVGNFEVLPALKVSSYRTYVCGSGVLRITTDRAASTVTLRGLSTASPSHHNKNAQGIALNPPAKNEARSLSRYRGFFQDLSEKCR